MIQEKKRALGSEAVITVVGEPKTGQTEELLNWYWQKILQFELRFSRFLPDSELMRLNRSDGQYFTASAEMMAILQTSKKLYQQTGGVFNPAILPALETAGYSDSFERLPDERNLSATKVLVAPDFSQIKIDDKKREVFLPAGWRLDLGGIGKGYLLDQLADEMAQNWDNFWLSLGGDLVAQGKNELGQPWPVGFGREDGQTLKGEMFSVGPKREAVATSGKSKRRGWKNGRPWHHLIDPQTGRPAVTAVTQATVRGPQATACDVLAKCVVIAGPAAVTAGLFQNEYKIVNLQ